MKPNDLTSFTAAEQSIVYLVLTDNSLAREVEVSPDQFTSRMLERMFAGALEMIDEGKVADVMTLANHLDDKYPGINWLPELLDMHQQTIARAEAIQTYSDQIKTRYQKTSAERIAYNLLANLNSGDGAVDEAIRDLMALNQEKATHDHSTKEILKGALDRTEEAFNAATEGRLVGLDTGLTELNQICGGWHDTDLIVIPARPAMGKTAVMLNFCLNAEVPFGVISSEQAYDQMGMRMISIEGRVSGAKIRAGRLEDKDWSNITAGVGNLSKKQMYINDDPTVTIDGIRRQARKWKHDHDIKLLAVDYIQRIYPVDKKAPKHIQVEEVVKGLKSLAKELGIPILALAQVNRECEKRDDKRPVTSDIADASAVEKEADLIITLYRDEVYNPDSQYKGVMELGITKNRHGPIGVVHSRWHGAFFKLADLNFGVN